VHHGSRWQTADTYGVTFVGCFITSNSVYWATAAWFHLAFAACCCGGCGLRWQHAKLLRPPVLPLASSRYSMRKRGTGRTSKDAAKRTRAQPQARPAGDARAGQPPPPPGATQRKPTSATSEEHLRTAVTPTNSFFRYMGSVNHANHMVVTPKTSNTTPDFFASNNVHSFQR